MNEGCNLRATYTYGSPRVGNLAFYQGYNPLTYRFVNNNDLVPHVPLEFLIAAVTLGDVDIFGRPAHGLLHFTYKHVGTLKYMGRHGKLGEGMNDWDQKKEFMMKALMETGGRFEPEAVADHHIWNYVKAVGSNLPQEA
jgi:hypothetical protein